MRITNHNDRSWCRNVVSHHQLFDQLSFPWVFPGSLSALYIVEIPIKFKVPHNHFGVFLQLRSNDINALPWKVQFFQQSTYPLVWFVFEQSFFSKISPKMLYSQIGVALVHPKQVFKIILKWRANKFFKNLVTVSVHLHLPKGIFQRITNT